MFQPRTGERKGAKQGAKRFAAAGLEFEGCLAVRAGRMGVEKGGDLLLEYVPLDGAEEVFGLGQRQPEMLDTLVVLVEGDDIGDSLFVTVIVRDNELQCDAHSKASPARVTSE